MRKQYTAAYKSQIILEAPKETKSAAQVAPEHQLHPSLVTKWKQEAVAELPVVFERRNTQAYARKPSNRRSHSFTSRSTDRLAKFNGKDQG